MKIVSKIQNLSTYKKYLSIKKITENFLQKNNLLSIDLPVLSPALIPESYLEIFKTEYIGFNNKEDLYLTPSPELFLKRLLVEGIGDCYYLGKSFRNGEVNGIRHDNEFTMLELYKINATYKDIMTFTHKLIQDLAQSIYSSMIFEYNNITINVDNYHMLTVAEAFKTYAGIDDIFDEQKFIYTAKEKGYKVDGFTYTEVWSQVYGNEIESKLGFTHPTYLYDYPVQFAPLSKPNLDGKTAQRFELYIAGIEIGNCYSELTDPKLQEKRLQLEKEERYHSGKQAYKPDDGFLEALKKGMPDSSGIAIGFDRLAMIFSNSKSIQEMKLITLE